MRLTRVLHITGPGHQCNQKKTLHNTYVFSFPYIMVEWEQTHFQASNPAMLITVNYHTHCCYCPSALYQSDNRSCRGKWCEYPLKGQGFALKQIALRWSEEAALSQARAGATQPQDSQVEVPCETSSNTACGYRKFKTFNWGWQGQQNKMQSMTCYLLSICCSWDSKGWELQHWACFCCVTRQRPWVQISTFKKEHPKNLSACRTVILRPCFSLLPDALHRKCFQRFGDFFTACTEYVVPATLNNAMQAANHG